MPKTTEEEINTTIAITFYKKGCYILDSTPSYDEPVTYLCKCGDLKTNSYTEFLVYKCEKCLKIKNEQKKAEKLEKRKMMERIICDKSKYDIKKIIEDAQEFTQYVKNKKEEIDKYVVEPIEFMKTYVFENINKIEETDKKVEKKETKNVQKTTSAKPTTNKNTTAKPINNHNLDSDGEESKEAVVRPKSVTSKITSAKPTTNKNTTAKPVNNHNLDSDGEESKEAVVRPVIDVENLNEYMKIVYNILMKRNCQIIELTPNMKSNDDVSYICACNNFKKEQAKYIKNSKGCRKCSELRYAIEREITFERYVELLDIDAVNITDERLKKELELVEKIKEIDEIDENTEEIWRRIPGGWISSEGNARNLDKVPLTLSLPKNRYKINGSNEYVTRLVAIAFKIPDYKKLIENSQSYCASHIDENIDNINNVNNIKVISKIELGIKNVMKRGTTNNVLNKLNLNLHEMLQEHNSIRINILPNHIIFENGEIYSEPAGRFLAGTKSENRIHISIDGNNYYLHRLVCFAFNKLPCRNNFEDYNDLQVNHKDGNTLNNCASNLEWVTQSENMLHAYEKGLNKKCRAVLQYDPDTDEFIAEYSSIAQASVMSKDSTSQISQTCKNYEIGKGKVGPAKFNWRYKFPEESEEYTRKYSSKPKKK